MEKEFLEGPYPQGPDRHNVQRWNVPVGVHTGGSADSGALDKHVGQVGNERVVDTEIEIGEPNQERLKAENTVGPARREPSGKHFQRSLGTRRFGGSRNRCFFKHNGEL